MNGSPTPIFSPSKRTVRVYAALLLQEMHQEWDQLENKIFPELRRLCRKRHVEFVVKHSGAIAFEQDVDQNEMFSRCFSEIEQCRPYFVALIGRNYGWIPEVFDPELVAKHLWLVDHLDKSFFELQILHAALNNPTAASNSFFYFSDEPRSHSNDAPDSQESSRDTDSIIKLAALKGRIAKSGLPLRTNCSDADTLARFVLEDLWTAIDRDFPASKIPTDRERLNAEHADVAHSRISGWVPRRKLLRTIDRYIRDSSRPLVVSGESGIGKASLLANWAARYRLAHPKHTLIVHFMDGTPKRCDSAAMTARVMEEISYADGMVEPLPDSAENMVDRLLADSGGSQESRRTILVIHGLNRIVLDEGQVLPDWSLFTRSLGVSIIISAAPGPVLSKLEQLGATRLDVKGLEPFARREIVQRFIDMHSWPLADHHIDRIVQAHQTANPLFLKLMLEDFRICSKASLDPETQLNEYLEAETIAELYDRILERWERDYEKHVPNLVNNVLTLLWASRSGLYESELLELMYELDQPTAFQCREPFFAALSPFLVNSSGLLTFFHRSFRDAVEKRYLKTQKAVEARHLRLALHFLHYEHSEMGNRRIEELPWQLRKAQAWEGLKNTITNANSFRRLYDESDQTRLMFYWDILSKQYDMPNELEKAAAAYEKSGPSAGRLAEALVTMADFLKNKGAHESAERLRSRVREVSAGIPDMLT